MLELARTLQASGHIDVVDVNDNPRARARMNGLIASATIERVVGLGPFPTSSPRDAWIAGLESMLLGAPPRECATSSPSRATRPRRRLPGAHSMYKIDSIGLSQMVRA